MTKYVSATATTTPAPVVVPAAGPAAGPSVAEDVADAIDGGSEAAAGAPALSDAIDGGSGSGKKDDEGATGKSQDTSPWVTYRLHIIIFTVSILAACICFMALSGGKPDKTKKVHPEDESPKKYLAPEDPDSPPEALEEFKGVKTTVEEDAMSKDSDESSVHID